MVKYLIAECFDPTRDDACAAPIIGIRLIHEERGISDFPINLRVPVFVFDRFTIPIPELREFFRTPVDIQSPQRQMVCDRIEADSRLVQQFPQGLRSEERRVGKEWSARW